MPLTLVNWADQARPEIGFLVRLFSCILIFVFLCRCYPFFNHQERVLFVDDVAFLRAAVKHAVGIALCQLAEITPNVGVVSHRACTLVRTRRYNVRFFSRLCFENPLAEAMYEAETLWTAWFDQTKDTIVLQSVPESVNHQLTGLRRGNFLEDVA